MLSDRTCVSTVPPNRYLLEAHGAAVLLLSSDMVNFVPYLDRSMLAGPVSEWRRLRRGHRRWARMLVRQQLRGYEVPDGYLV